MKKNPRLLSLIALLILVLVLGGTFAVDRQGIATAGKNRVPMIALVFDDAHRSLPDVFSILEERELVGTVFVPTELVGNYDFHTSWETIATLAQSGWEIGAHTKTHPDLRELMPLDAWEEIIGSKRQLIERGIPITSFAPPLGEMPESLLYDTTQHFETVRMAWGNRVVTVDSLGDDRYALPVFDIAHTGADRDNLIRLLDEAKPNALLIAVFHKIAKDGEGVDQYTTRYEAFCAFVDEIRARKDRNTLRIATLSDGIRELEMEVVKPFWKRWLGMAQ